jgi:hypothetical protein
LQKVFHENKKCKRIFKIQYDNEIATSSFPQRAKSQAGCGKEDQKAEEKQERKAMTQTEIIVLLSDIRFVEIHCSHCTTKLTLDMREPSEFSQKNDGAFAPKECPGCRKDYDSAVRPAVHAFQRAYQSLLEIPKSITFRGVSGHV